MTPAMAIRLREVALNSKHVSNSSDSQDLAAENPTKFVNVLVSEKMASPSTSASIESKLRLEAATGVYTQNVLFPYGWSYLLYQLDSYHDWHIDAYDSVTPTRDYEPIAYTAIISLTPDTNQRFEFQQGVTPELLLGDCLVFDGTSTFNTHRIKHSVSSPLIVLTNYAYYQ